MAWSDPLASSIWSAVRARLEAHADFSLAPAIPVVPRFTGEPEEELDAALGAAGKSGLIVTVSEPAFDITSSTGTGLGRFEVLIAEVPVLNRGVGGTGRTCQEIEEAVLESFLGWSPSGILMGTLLLESAADRPEEGRGMVRRLIYRFGIMLSPS